MNVEEINKKIDRYTDSNNEMAIIELMMSIDPMGYGNSIKIASKGIFVPFRYAVGWVETFVCNNWRKLHDIPMMRGLPMKRKQQIKCNNR